MLSLWYVLYCVGENPVWQIATSIPVLNLKLILRSFTTSIQKYRNFIFFLKKLITCV